MNNERKPLPPSSRKPLPDWAPPTHPATRAYMTRESRNILEHANLVDAYQHAPDPDSTDWLGMISLIGIGIFIGILGASALIMGLPV